jgi:hypothetical protein
MLQTFDSPRIIEFVLYKNLSAYNNLSARGIASLYNQKSTYNNRREMADGIDWSIMILPAIWPQARGE